MALQRTKLGNIQFIPTSVGPVYTNPASTKTYIRGIIVFNSNVTLETVNIYNVPASGGSVGVASTGNQFLSVALSNAQTFFLELPYVITLTDTNETIQASTTTGSRVTIQILGDKE